MVVEGLRGAVDGAEVVIVGGGMAGLQVASELQARGIDDVLILEAGANFGGGHMNASFDSTHAFRRYQLMDDDPSYSRPWTAVAPPHYGPPSGLRQRLGGRSLCWHGITLRIEPWALRSPFWPKSVVADLTESWRGGPCLYEEQEQILGEWAGPQGPSDPLVDLLLSSGVPAASTPVAVRRRPDLGPDRWEAYSPLFDMDLEAPSPVIACSVHVQEVVVEGAAVAGLMVEDRKHARRRRVSCSTVVLAAGTIANTALAIPLLHRLGLSPGLRAGGLRDHLYSGLLVKMPPGALPTVFQDVPPGLSYVSIARADCRRSNLFVAWEPGLNVPSSKRGDVLMDVVAIGEQTHSAENWIEIDAESREVAVRGAFSAEDRETIVGQQAATTQTMRKLLTHLGMERSMLPAEPSVDEVDRLPTYSSLVRGDLRDCRRYIYPLGAGEHEGCTLPLGRLLDDRGQFPGVAGLYAAGPCTFPRPGASNPSLTTLALAKRLGRQLAESR